MNHFAAVFGFIGRLYAIRVALDYDLRDLRSHERQLAGAAARLWHSNMRAWKAASM